MRRKLSMMIDNQIKQQEILSRQNKELAQLKQSLSKKKKYDDIGINGVEKELVEARLAEQEIKNLKKQYEENEQILKVSARKKKPDMPELPNSP